MLAIILVLNLVMLISSTGLTFAGTQPLANNVVILSGQPIVGQTLTGSYEYYHPDGVSECKTVTKTKTVTIYDSNGNAVKVQKDYLYYSYGGVDSAVFWWEINGSSNDSVVGWMCRQKSFTLRPEDVGKQIQFYYRPIDANGTKGKQYRSEPMTVTTIPPVITLNGAERIVVYRSAPFTDPGATAQDLVDGNLSDSVIISGDIVDTSVAGVYKISYDVTNSLGMKATQVKRIVYVLDANPNNDVALYFNADRFDHAHDDNYNTSANIYSQDGYIVYTVAQLGLTSQKIQFVMNGRYGEAHWVPVELYNAEFNMIGSTHLPIEGYKNSYTYIIPDGTIYIKILGIENQPLYIYEIEDGLSPSAPSMLSKCADNLADGHDGNYDTSANIYNHGEYIVDRFITYSLEELGVLPGTTIALTMNDSENGTNTVYVESVREFQGRLEEIHTSVYNINGHKGVYFYNIHAEATHLSIHGTLTNTLYIYEIQPWTGPTTQFIFSKSADNLADGHDNNFNSSANIYNQGLNITDAFITYSLAELGVLPGTTIALIMNDSENGTNTVVVESRRELEDVLENISYNIFNINGHKGVYLYDVDANATHITIYRTPTNALYIYEIQPWTGQPPVSPESSVGVDHIDHAYDGNNNTSANIFVRDAFIDFDINVLRTSDEGIQVMANCADGGAGIMGVMMYSEQGTILAEFRVDMAGYKNIYTLNKPIPEGTSTVRIISYCDQPLYIYEIEAQLAFMPAQAVLSQDANNLDHGHDGSLDTSANIFSETGFITYSTAELGCASGDTLVLTMNDSENLPNTVSIVSKDDSFDVITNSDADIGIDGHKGNYTYAVPTGTAYITIYGVTNNALYIYEVKKQ